MNWGTRIFIAYLAGVLFIGYFVVRSMMLTTEMAEEDYYGKELAFNAHIQGVDNAKNLAQPIMITDKNTLIEVVIDSLSAHSMKNGAIHFYNPASEKADKKMVLNPSNGIYHFEKNRFSKGKYIVRVSFDLEGKPYFTEETILIK
jgi:nitrogen fixation protein FixH